MHFTKFIPFSFFHWCENTALGTALKHSMWGFAVIETIHIMGLTVLIGTILIVDLRLLGFGLQSRPTPRLAKDLAPWTLSALLVVIATGICLYLSEAVRLGQSDPFFFKMIFLSAALIVHITLYRRATQRVAPAPAMDKTAAYLSLALWLAVALAGRGIAFL